MSATETPAPRAERTAPKPRGRPFPPGKSANPAGRPKGVRNKTTLAVEALLDGQAEALANKAVELGLAGDGAILRTLLGMIVPPRKDRPVLFALPALDSAADALRASAALVTAVARGDLTPGEAGEIGALIQAHTKLLEVADLERRIAALEHQGTSA